MQKLLGVIGVLAALIYGLAMLGFGAAYASHGGDDAWRNQKVINWLQTSILTVVTLVFLLVVVEMYRARAKASRGIGGSCLAFH